ncbi:MAG: AI-2E family transporter [Desulforhabdus sp.]|jgi:predicted PurR-regulated permease PerM|nr:AI-2E family transporter [Desulforhabdus sp.]
MTNEQTDSKRHQRQEGQSTAALRKEQVERASSSKHDRKIERRILLFLLILGIAYTLYLARDFLLPICISLLLSFVLQPLVRGLEWLKLPTALAAAIVIVSSVAVIGTAVYHLSNPAVDWINRGPIIRQQLEFKFRKIKHSLKEAQETTKQLENLAELESKETPEVIVKGPTLGSKLFAHTQNTIMVLFVIIVLTFFLLWRGPATMKRVIKTFALPHQAATWTDMMVSIERQIALYLQTITLINCVLGATTAGAMALVGMPTPILWGVVAGLFNFLPYLGAAVTFFILGIVSALTFDTWFRIALAPAVFAMLTVLEGQIITPTVLGNRLSIDPILVFASILFWGWAWGVAGVLVAVPILSVLKIIFSKAESLKPYEELFG